MLADADTCSCGHAYDDHDYDGCRVSAAVCPCYRAT
jgi:hypothetical protein